MSQGDSFVVARTFAAPFVSETIERYVEGEPRAAIGALVAQHRDGVGIYAAEAYATADDYHRRGKPKARWWSNKALAVKDAGSIYGRGPGVVEIDGKAVVIDDPKGGRFL